MSYILPTSSNSVTISSETENIASGTVSISITVKDPTLLFAPSYTMDILDIGSIEVDFNYIKDIGDINEFKVNVPRMEFTILDRITRSDGLVKDSFVGLISDLSASDIIVIQMTFNGVSDYYYATRDNCEFSFSKRSVNISALHPIKFGLLPPGSTWGASYFNGRTVVVNYGAAGSDDNEVLSVLPRDLIEGYLNQLGSSVSIKYKSLIYSETYSDTFVDNQKVFLPSEYSAGQSQFDTAPYDFGVATTRVKEYALGECAIIGNILGYGFYIPRFDKSIENRSTLTVNDFLSLDMNIKFRDVRFYSFEAEHSSTESVSINNEVINPLGTVDASISYPYPEFQDLAYWWSAADEFQKPVALYEYPSNFEGQLKLAFKKVLRVSDSFNSVDPGVYISGTILGIDKLRPYEYFRVPSGVHPLVDGKDFRPSYIKYDLKNDTVQFEAYEF